MPRTVSAAKHVVIAADNAGVRERFRAALEQAGHRVVPVTTAAELLARVQSESAEIDLIVVDLHISSGAGADVVAAVRKLDEGRLRILVFSGTVDNADDVRALSRLNVTGYVNEHCASQLIVSAVTPFLFPDTFNRRDSPRVVLGIPVQYRIGQTIAAALTLNLSHGGIGIRTSAGLDAGTLVRVRFKLPGAEDDIDAEGRVAWSHHRIGMGVQFGKLDAGPQAQVDNFVDAHFLSHSE
jgi:uncharacterized protein (TIGR02266 family)